MAINFSKDYYALLETESFADLQTLRKSYYRLAKRYHPDRNPGDESAEEKFKEIAEAYAFLSDSYYKALYDDRRRKGPPYKQDDAPHDSWYSAPEYYSPPSQAEKVKHIEPRLFYVALILLLLFRNSCNNNDRVHSFKAAKILFDSVRMKDTVIFFGQDSVHIYQPESSVFILEPQLNAN